MTGRRLRRIGSLLALALVASACATDPTTSEEYQQLASDKAATETQLSETESQLTETMADLEAKTAALSDSEAQLAEMQSEVASLESDKAEADQRAEDLQGELEVWKQFAGSPNDEPYLWSQELFDAWMLTCTSDGTSQDSCVCFVEGVESQASLMELMLMYELFAAAEFGLVEVNQATDLPEGVDPDLVGVITVSAIDCL